MLTFVHTADWQIGRPFRGFGDRIGALLEEARLDTIESIAAVARGRGARHVLVAGDVFDSDTLPLRAVVPALDRLARCADVTWHMISGNHDPGRVGGLWHRIVARGLPANVKAHLERGTHEIESGAVLLAAPVASKGRGADPTDWMDGIDTPGAAVRIGLAHGSVYDFAGSGSDGEGVIDPRRAEKAQLTYLALGDWHGAKRIGDSTWYSGTPEPDRFGDDSSGQVLVVQLREGMRPAVDAVRTGHYIWKKFGAQVSGAEDLDRLQRVILDMAPAPERLLLRLSLSGNLDIEAMSGLAAWQERIAERIRYLEVAKGDLAAKASGADLARLLSDSSLITVADRLRKRADGSNAGERRIAEDALLKLIELARTGIAEGA